MLSELDQGSLHGRRTTSCNALKGRSSSWPSKQSQAEPALVDRLGSHPSTHDNNTNTTAQPSRGFVTSEISQLVGLELLSRYANNTMYPRVGRHDRPFSALTGSGRRDCLHTRDQSEGSQASPDGNVVGVPGPRYILHVYYVGHSAFQKDCKIFQAVSSQLHGSYPVASASWYAMSKPPRRGIQ